jgi:hypothetical protein
MHRTQRTIWKKLGGLGVLAAGLTLGAIAAWPEAARGLAQEKPAQGKKDYSRFTHQTHLGTVKVPGTSQTRELKCDACHERQVPRAPVPMLVATTQRNEQLQLKFPGHKACVECHVTQFTSRPLETCVICHRSGQALKAQPPLRDFPARLDFNAFFDAKQHEAHVAYKLPDGQSTTCAFCHQPTAKQAALTIPSHPECYVCHAPASGEAKASLKSGCLVCHTQMVATVQPFSTKYRTKAYGARFTHRTHVAYANDDCAACHTISGGYNQPVPRTIKTTAHLGDAERGGRGCFSCHDGVKQYRGRPIFSGDDFGKCDQCHTPPNYKVSPTDG